MKRWWLLAVSVVLVGGLTFFSSGKRGSHKKACKTLVAACERAGFKRGGSPQERREFHHNCLMPIFTKGDFLGETFDPKIVSSCKAVFEKRRMRSKES